MSIELELLSSALSDAALYRDIQQTISLSRVSLHTKTLLDLIGRYYETDTKATSVKKELLKERIKVEYPRHQDILIDILDAVPETTSGTNVADLWNQQCRLVVGNRLAEALLDNNTANINKYLAEYTEIGSKTTSNTVIYNDVDIVQFRNAERKSGTIPLPPRCIDTAVDSQVTRGEQIIVFGRPNSGKTAYAINASAVWIKRGLRVLFLENEDPACKVLYRLISRLTGWTYKEVLDNPTGATERARQHGYSNFYLKDLTPGTIPEIEALIKQHKPDCVVVNQIRNLDMGVEGLTQTLEQAVIGMRTVTKRENILSMLVTQAGDSATDKLVLKSSDVEYSKTGVQAQCDVLIGIGKNEEFDEQDRIMITLCRNKLTDIHKSFPVVIDKQRTKLRSL